MQKHGIRILGVRIRQPYQWRTRRDDDVGVIAL